MKIYTKTAEFYDLEYKCKDYKKEVKFLHQLIIKNKKSKGKDLLDVACGTGNHIQFLKKYYNCTGTDLSKQMLKIAKRKFPKITFKQANMINFKINKKFDVITCLFSAISLVKTYKNFEKTIQTMKKHLKPGGIIIIQPFVHPNKWRKGYTDVEVTEDDVSKLVRVVTTKRKGMDVKIDMHFLLAKKENIKHYREILECALFDPNKCIAIMKKQGLKAKYLKTALSKDRGLYVATLPL